MKIEHQRIDRLGEWAHLDEHGWTHSMSAGVPYWYRVDEDGDERYWNPFTDLNHARLLLLECKRRGLLSGVSEFLWKTLHEAEMVRDDDLEMGLLTTAEQQTEAVWAAAGLGEIVAEECELRGMTGLAELAGGEAAEAAEEHGHGGSKEKAT